MSKYVYYFSDEDTLKQDKDVLGGKGFGLISLKKLGISVPPAFVITTQACKQYHNGGGDFFVNLRSEIDANIQKLEKETGKQFGGHDNPLLVSVRSGAAVSMPGMMDTILNLGLNDDTVEALASKSGNTRFALDSYRRFIQMFSNVAMGLDHKQFEQVLEKEKEEQGVEFDYQLSEESLIRIILQYKGIYRKELGQGFPQDVRKQLELGIKAVFDSWNNDRAKSYRRINNIQGLTGTAVNIQAMVFGNLSDNSGTGVIFTRNPNNGKKGLYGEYLINAQGEDVVAGIRTPKDVSSLGDVLPGVYKELVRIAEKLEEHFRDMQDIEFTVENGKLYILQTRSGKRNADAAINIAVAMEREDLITKEEALLRIDAKSLDQLLHPRIKNGYENKVLGQGLPASPGAVTGKISFSPVTSREYFENGESVIMVRNETTPEDIEDMNISAGILTARGGMTSHAAVVGRGMGKCCVVGCKELLYEDGRSKCKIGDYVLSEGDVITLDGGSGKILLGQVEKVQARMNDNFGQHGKLVR